MKTTKIKCKHCKKEYGEHKSNGLFCPMGSKKKTLGYTQFHNKNKYQPNLKFYYICGLCAVKAGLTWPEGYCATSHMDNCLYCNEIEGLCAISDYLLPNQKELKFWD